MATSSPRRRAPFPDPPLVPPLSTGRPHPATASVALAAVLVLFSASAGAAAGAASGASRARAVPEIPVPDDRDLALWTKRILPPATELEWERIPWIPNLGDGVRTAEAEGRPVLLWLMNGHPCGCT